MTFLGFPLESAAAFAEYLLIGGGILVAALAGLVSHLNNRVKIAEKLATFMRLASALRMWSADRPVIQMMLIDQGEPKRFAELLLTAFAQRLAGRPRS